MRATPLRLGQVADQLGVSISTSRRLVNRGELPGYKVGYQIRVDQEDVDAYRARQRAAATAAQQAA